MIIQEYTHFEQTEIMALYESVGWTNYTSRPDMLKTAFQKSLLTLALKDGDRMVGLLRAVGDGASIVYIQDLLIMPAYQNRGFGHALMNVLMERFPAVYQIVLVSDNQISTTAFYESCGFSNVNRLGCHAFLRMLPA